VDARERIASGFQYARVEALRVRLQVPYREAGGQAGHHRLHRHHGDDARRHAVTTVAPGPRPMIHRREGRGAAVRILHLHGGDARLVRHRSGHDEEPVHCCVDELRHNRFEGEGDDAAHVGGRPRRIGAGSDVDEDVGRKLSWRSARAGRATAQRHAVARNRDGGKGIGCCCAGWVRLLAGGAALLNSGSAR